MLPAVSLETNNPNTKSTFPRRNEEIMDPQLSLSLLLSQGWVAKKIATFLDAKNVTRFASASRDCRVVRLRWVPITESSLHRYGNVDVYYPSLWQTLPVVRNAHTVMMKCKWYDQGWGNRKGMLSVVTKDGRAPDDYKPWSEDVVVGAEPAPHRKEPLSLSFRPRQDEDQQPYGIWVRVGGGGGHQLSVKDLRVGALVYE